MEAYRSNLGLLTHLLTHWSVQLMLLYPIWSLSPGFRMFFFNLPDFSDDWEVDQQDDDQGQDNHHKEAGVLQFRGDYGDDYYDEYHYKEAVVLRYSGDYGDDEDHEYNYKEAVVLRYSGDYGDDDYDEYH